MKVKPKFIAIITLLAYWAPSNLLWYFWGFILLFILFAAKRKWLIIRGSHYKRIFVYTVSFFVLVIISFLVNYWRYDSSVNNLVWTLLTYGASLSVLLVFLCIPFTIEDQQSIFNFSIGLAFFQTVVGGLQMLSSQGFQYFNPFSGGKDIGDFFIGTTFSLGIGHLVSIKLAMMALLFLPIWFNHRNRSNSIKMFFLMLGWILPSALFTLVVGVATIVVLYVVPFAFRVVFTGKIQRSLLAAVVSGIVVLIIFLVTQRNNVSYLLTSFEHIFSTLTGEQTADLVPSRKIIYYQKTILELPEKYPSMFWIGFGPGNYSSRSAWLVSGGYLGHQPSYIPVTPSRIAKEHVLTVWNNKMINDEFKGAGSIVHQPFSTWLSLFAELGILGPLLISGIFISLYRMLGQSLPNETDSFTRNLFIGHRIVIVYVCLLFFAENLLEYPIVMGQFFVLLGVSAQISKGSKSIES